MVDKFSAEYIAGGAAQNTARVAQVISSCLLNKRDF